MTTKKKLCLCVLPLSAIAIVLIWSAFSGESMTFRVVDRKTGKPLTNAFVAISERWTKLPVEKLQISSLTRSRRRIIRGEDGLIRVRGLPSKLETRLSLSTDRALPRSLSSHLHPHGLRPHQLSQ
jgi:hypothetical protein